jgi:hypothetical protein
MGSATQPSEPKKKRAVGLFCCPRECWSLGSLAMHQRGKDVKNQSGKFLELNFPSLKCLVEIKACTKTII